MNFEAHFLHGGCAQGLVGHKTYLNADTLAFSRLLDGSREHFYSLVSVTGQKPTKWVSLDFLE